MSKPDNPHKCSVSEELVVVEVEMTREDAERLVALSDDCHAHPSTVASALLHDVLADDEIINTETALAAGAGVTFH